MVLDNLGDSLKRTMKKIANAVHVDSQLVKEVVRDIQRALLQSDVNVKLVLELSKKIEQRALEEKPPAGMTNREHVIHIVYAASIPENTKIKLNHESEDFKWFSLNALPAKMLDKKCDILKIARKAKRFYI